MSSEWFFFFFLEQYLYKLKCIYLCLRESGSSSSNDNCHLLLEAFSLVSNENILDSNPPFDNYQTKKVEFGSPPRLEGQYGCIDLVENHPSLGKLNRLFVLERERHSLRRFDLEERDNFVYSRYNSGGSSL